VKKNGILAKKTAHPPSANRIGSHHTSSGNLSKPVSATSNKYSVISSHGNNSLSKKDSSVSNSPRKLEIQTDLNNPDKPKFISSNTTTNADFDLMRRKFSHDVKYQNDSSTPQEKRSQINSSNSKKRNPYQGLDIGKALGGLKERIKKMLDKHKDGYNQLKLTHDIYLKKLEQLTGGLEGGGGDDDAHHQEQAN